MKESYRKGVANHLAPSLALLARGTQRSVDSVDSIRRRPGCGHRGQKLGGRRRIWEPAVGRGSAS